MRKAKDIIMELSEAELKTLIQSILEQVCEKSICNICGMGNRYSCTDEECKVKILEAFMTVAGVPFDEVWFKSKGRMGA